MKRILQFLLIICLVLSISGCAKYYPVEQIYDTEIYGVYSKTLPDHEPYKQELCFENNGQYKYTISDESGFDIFHITGTFTEKTINGDIVQIRLNNYSLPKISGGSYTTELITDEILYKYKNMIGHYIQTNIKVGDTFTITSYSDNQRWYTFSPCGTATLNINKDKVIPYIIKNNIIWMDFLSDGNYMPMYYLVEDGVFSASAGLRFIKV